MGSDEDHSENDRVSFFFIDQCTVSCGFFLGGWGMLVIDLYFIFVVQPTICHYFIRMLHEKGLLRRHYTQVRVLSYCCFWYLSQRFLHCPQ